MTDVVVDASATVEIFLGTLDGRSLARQVPPQAVEWVPEVYFAEVAGALRRAELTRRITTTAANHYLSQLLAAPSTEQPSSRYCRRLGRFGRTSQ